MWHQRYYYSILVGQAVSSDARTALPTIRQSPFQIVTSTKKIIRYFIRIGLQLYMNLLPFPRRGLKYLLSLLERLNLLDHAFHKKLPGGIRLTLCFRDHIQRQLLWYGHYEPIELQLAGKLLPANGVVIDAGANIGYHSIYFSRRCPAGRVYSFEPSPAVFDQLLSNLQRNGIKNIQPHQLALDADNREQLFHLSGLDNTGMGGFMDTGNASGKTEIVSCERLDDFIRRKDIPSLDLVKIDVEGAEVRVLKGMAYILDVLKPAVLVECSSTNLAYHGENLSTLYTLMSGHGYFPFEAVDGKTLRIVSGEKELSLAFFLPKEKVGQYNRIRIER